MIDSYTDHTAALLDGLSAMALLWVEFVKQLRERWVALRLLPAMVRCCVDLLR